MAGCMLESVNKVTAEFVCFVFTKIATSFQNMQQARSFLPPVNYICMFIKRQDFRAKSQCYKVKTKSSQLSEVLTITTHLYLGSTCRDVDTPQ